ncbi:hypothetical protein Anapl_03844 [Anas platyrhynchos]|uniref:Probetacellulin n=1 Tax=Anas platyrhynchos TaxID=8839 RepID=R0LAN3_ANAPL|nr:hypothetical protein Anapl_03844 [Anas platyrhynchos]
MESIKPELLMCRLRPSFWGPRGATSPRSIPGLALFSCVGADANVTEGLPCEGCAGNRGAPSGVGVLSGTHPLISAVSPSRQQPRTRAGSLPGSDSPWFGEHLGALPPPGPPCARPHRCEPGYMGARCELVDIFPLRGDRGQIVVISLIAGIIVLIIFVVCTCFCVHHCRKQRRKRKEEEMETLSKNLPSKSEDVLETDVA